MSSFKGSYHYSVDSKGRVNLPAKLRKYVSPEANDLFVVTRGYDNCIFVYPQDEWNKLESSIRQLSSTNPKHRFFTRTLCQYATELPLDGQARLSIPRELLQIAGLENEALIIGVLERIEIWHPTRFEEYQKAQSESYETVAQTVFPP
ncbi:MAG: division/cell wall cluster transcriptional repressor MraZ [Bacteroidota bacterium]